MFDFVLLWGNNNNACVCKYVEQTIRSGGGGDLLIHCLIFYFLFPWNTYLHIYSPQVAMATAQVLFQRFFYMASLKEFGIVVSSSYLFINLMD